MRDQCSVPIAGENSQVRGKLQPSPWAPERFPYDTSGQGMGGLICCSTWVVCVQMRKDRLLRKGEEFKSSGQTRAERDVHPATQGNFEPGSKMVKKKKVEVWLQSAKTWQSELGQLKARQVLYKLKRKGPFWDESTGQRACSTNFVSVSSANCSYGLG